jgi:CPA1 family monovalent cation:H+ antiporter
VKPTVNIEQTDFLLLIAAVVAILTRRLRLPYTIGLVVAGVGLALLRAPEITLTKELIFNLFLPPLIFDAAFCIPWLALRRELPLVLVLATLGVVLAAAVTTLGMYWVAGWPWPAALLFGTLIAATDPVSVIATFKEAGAQGRLRLLVEAESLLNDGTAAVALSLAIVIVQGQALSGVGMTFMAAKIVLGGVLCGLGVGGLILWLAGSTDDHLVEITFTTVAAFGSFLLAEHFHFSGILATLTTGLLIGNCGSIGSITDKGREAVGAFWEYAAFVANSLIFLLLGVQLSHQKFTLVLFPSVIAILFVMLGRAAAVYPCCWLFSHSARRVKPRHQHVLFWGGLRGALALALALGLPAGTAYEHEIQTVAFAVVAFSVIVQGLTIKPLLHDLGKGDTAPTHH